MSTIKDVARAAGLSVTTVSRALNNHGDVAETTRRHIQEVARALDYHPNEMARSLQGSYANAIGVVIPRLLHSSYDAFWLEFIGGMAATCARREVDLLVSTAEMHDDAGHGFQRLVRGRRVDGLLIGDISCTDPRISYLQRRHLPFVAFGRTTGPLDYSFIDVDGAAGVVQVMEYLIRLGHRRIAYLGVNPRYGFSHYRFAGYCQVLAMANLDYDPALAYHSLAEQTIPSALSTLMALPERPTAIFAGADFLALAVLKTARAMGLEVPADLSLAVFDDNLLVQHAEPALTAVQQPTRWLGEEAATILLDLVMDGSRPPVQRLIVPRLVVRQSTAAPHYP